MTMAGEAEGAGGIRADIACGRLPLDAYLDNFSDIHPALGRHEAKIESDRCYFCYDAPCVKACPTAIDIPLFIRKISTGNVDGAAATIFAANILGGMCARVCPTETLCEEACVRNTAEDKPVTIGLLQRHATDAYMAAHATFGQRKAPTGRRVAVVGAGPAGLACAHALALEGHDVTIFEARPKPGGLNEYGIAAYKAVGGFAQHEVDFVTAIGGITIETGKALGRDLSLAGLAADFDAVFLGMGLSGVNALGLAGEAGEGVVDAVDWIAVLRQAEDRASVPVGRRVVVVGGGMTAIDAAVQAKKLGAEEVTIVYRRGEEAMNASPYERDLARKAGVLIRTFLRPVSLGFVDGHVDHVVVERTRLDVAGRPLGTGETLTLPADQVMKAIGQTIGDKAPFAGGVALEAGRVRVDAAFRTSMPKVWAGGDCTGVGEDLTVVAVAQGKAAAASIHAALAG
ncbi:NAD(P)-dependent oxidoreductase [Methylobrevis pamukkalensis]|uniref:dihydrouracil dehydrogenase (NAD(+)) n=1 Tax=Methylobrevis pamukkalensis TaxID=1439726 RepID=A0A1E3H363_9HYPH|nr:NAD(P)-dependent oxidoreductase [Methylobrevis pamukkalensis]ODN70575.1 NAD-dependent dihydropyrimidine dehydrogenase subunit PreT [Methylobrevis pamukkalensis]